MPTDPSAPRLIAPKVLAKRLGVTELTLRNWRAAGTGPPWIKLNGFMIRYDPNDIDEWIESQREGAPAA